MEEQMSAKRRCVYPLEPSLIAQTMFVRNYVSHLVPALTRIKTCRLVDDNYGHDSELDESVRHEVDMALVMSTPGFAWSRALKRRLHKNTNAGRFHDSSIDHHASLKRLSMHGPSILKNDADNHCSPNVTSQKRVSPSPNGKATINKRLKRARSKTEAAEQSDEEEQIGSRLASLRSLMPGGNEMGVDELFSDMGSYIASLEMQVNILRGLVDSQY
ncbi:PREDICTED: uncharacterized protein At4g30180-like [Populus euphratica]|uniref:Uncharacterized protein At4g30180-like n=1 Tax=Populus euphratica TaxID=75702 RepID=A0AAJ6VA64_POPEU|nr:PREDICTED: uncharacterized protein At4g30180-like [Populus euphratica]